MSQLKTLIFTLCFVFIISFGSAKESTYPLIIASGKSLEDLSSVFFNDHKDLLSVLFSKFQQTGAPQKNLIYVISTPHEALETVSFISQNRNKYPNLMDLLKNKKKSFSSKYVEYSDLEFQETLLQKLDQNVLQSHEHSFLDADFKVNHHFLMNSSSISLETIQFDLMDLKDLNVLLYQDLQLLSKQSDSYAIYVVFKRKSPSFRALQEESTETTTTDTTTSTGDATEATSTEATSTEATSTETTATETTANETIANETTANETTTTTTDSTSSTTDSSNSTNSTNNTDLTLRIQPYVMTGYLFSLFATVIVLIGAVMLCSVQAPEKFPRLPLLVGRESN